MVLEHGYDAQLDMNYTRERKKPFPGRVKVYVVDENDEDRERVLHFETDHFFIDVDSDFEDIHSGYSFKPLERIRTRTRYNITIGELNELDDRGTVMRVENFLKDNPDDPTYNEDDYE